MKLNYFRDFGSRAHRDTGPCWMLTELLSVSSIHTKRICAFKLRTLLGLWLPIQPEKSSRLYFCPAYDLTFWIHRSEVFNSSLLSLSTLSVQALSIHYSKMCSEAAAKTTPKIGLVINIIKSHVECQINIPSFPEGWSQERAHLLNHLSLCRRPIISYMRSDIR